MVGGSRGWSRGGGGWGSGGCKPRIEGIVKRGVRVQSGGRVVGGWVDVKEELK